MVAEQRGDWTLMVVMWIAVGGGSGSIGIDWKAQIVTLVANRVFG